MFKTKPDFGHPSFYTGASCILLAWIAAGSLSLASGAEVVGTFKSGIDVVVEGTEGRDYAVEDLYFDRTLADHRIVYLKSSTPIAMRHNVNNIAGNTNGTRDYTSAGPDVGIIKLKPDGDRRFGIRPKDWITYSKPVTFGELDYGMFGEPARKVVGATGDNGLPLNHDTKSSYLHYGILDSVGDEWHTLTVADDDSGGGRNNEFESSDGKVHLFVVNPKTPCLTWSVTGTGQFYTTPAKNYFVPHIHEQTTYLAAGGQGSVRVTISDINGNNIFYRINGGSFTDAGSDSITLDHSSFKNGENSLEYYYAGNSEHSKVRRVVKNPAYPSADEKHGDRLWNSAEDFAAHMEDRLKNDWWMGQWRTKESHHNHGAILAERRTGKRNVSSGRASHGGAIVNALVARVRGMDDKPGAASPHSYAEYAKFALFETVTNLDPVGAEIFQNAAAVPTRELQYRGYYDVRPIYGYAGAYDILAGYFRADQGFEAGLTAVEDHFIRDSLARWVHNCGMLAGGYSEVTNADVGGMWDTARKTGAAMIACMMPSYSTPYFGTSGLDGNRTTYNEIVFPTLNHTWFDLFLDNNVPVSGYPAVNSTMGVDEYLWAEDGRWEDSIPYADTPLTGMCIGIYYNLLKLFHPQKELPRLDRAMTLAAKGELTGKKIARTGDENPRFYSWAVMLNAWHPEFRAVAQPAALAKDSSHGQHPGKQMNTGGPFYILWYDRELPLGSGPGQPDDVVAPPAVAPPGGVYETPQMVEISSSTPGATIRYTSDGTIPTATTGSLYTSPVAVGAGSTTIRAIAVTDDLRTSSVTSASYTIGLPVAAPVLSPPGGAYDAPLEVALSSPTSGVKIYFTTDGTAPTEASGSLYTAPILIGEGNTTVRAAAFRDGSDPSPIASAAYIVATSPDAPQINPPQGVYAEAQWVSIAAQDPEAVIYYTVDGTEPSANSLPYEGQFKLDSSATIRAIAISAEGTVSAIATAAYQIGSVKSLAAAWGGMAIDPQSGTFKLSFNVTPQPNSLVGLSSGEAATWADLAAIVRFAPDRTVDARHGGVYKADAEFTYVEGLAYRVTMTVDVAAGTYSVEVAGLEGEFVTIAKDYAFRSEQATVETLDFVAIWSEIGLSAATGINIGAVDPPVPPPPTGIRFLQF